MGRYYNGDISGKFWFAVQDSNDADNFGGSSVEIYDTDDEGNETDDPIGMSYHFTEDDLPDINKGLDECIAFLGEYKEKLDAFFEKRSSYNNEMIVAETGADPEAVGDLLVHYARYDLGIKIKECVEREGTCSFDADYN